MCVMVLLYSSQYISSTYHIFPGLQIFLSEIESFWHVIESFPHEALVNFYCYLLLKHFESIVEKTPEQSLNSQTNRVLFFIRDIKIFILRLERLELVPSKEYQSLEFAVGDIL